MKGLTGTRRPGAVTVRETDVPPATAPAKAPDAPQAAPAADSEDQHRHSSPEMVALAQEVFNRTENHWRPEEMIDNHDWLREAARSLAGSVLSQADPSD